MARLRIADLPFDLAARAGDDGLHAETRADGSVARVVLQRGGRIVCAVRVDVDPASGETIEHFHADADEDDDEGDDALPAWLDGALRELSRRAAGLQVCAFCEKTNAEVAKLVMGPRQGICNECIVLCSEIIGDPAAPAG